MGIASRSIKDRRCKWCNLDLLGSVSDLIHHVKMCRDEVEVRQRMEASGLLTPEATLYVPRREEL